MADSFLTRSTRTESQSKAREILDGLVWHRIDPSRIKMIDSKPRAKGGQGTIVVGTRIAAPEAVTRWVPEQVLKMFLERKLAIKKLEWDREDAEASGKFFNSFVNELSIMAGLSHPNIVKFGGFVEDMEKGDAWIVLPWEANGNVREFLASGEWDIPERMSLIKGVANGVQYLHTRQPPICHGDLKSMNILVNSSYHAVITDFGSARTKGNVDPKPEDSGSEPPRRVPIEDIVEKLLSPIIKFNRSTLELTLTGPGYTLRWTAPEVLSSEVQDLPSDMWALGWICWEIFTGKVPFEDLRAMGPIISKVVKGQLPAIREEADLSHILELCSLMMDCWMSKPGERMDASTFRRKVSFMPSVTPSADRSGGAKVRSARLLCALGTTYQHQDNTVEAESHYQSAIEVATRMKDDTTKAHALFGLGVIFGAQSRYREAEKAFLESHEISSRIRNDLGMADVFLGLGSLYGAQSKHREAEKAFVKAHEVCYRIGSDLVGGKAFMKAHDIYTRIGSNLGAANALDSLGTIYCGQSRYREAEKASIEAHEIYSRIGYDKGAAEALGGLGHIYRIQSKYREAEKAFMEAHEIHSRIGNDMGTANALAGLGHIYAAQLKNREAEKAFMESHEIQSRIGNDLGAANALDGLGRVYGTQLKTREAEKAFTEAHHIHSRIGHDLGVANALRLLGNTYGAQSRNPEAEKALKAAHTIYSRIGHTIGTDDVSRSLAFLYSSQKRYDAVEGSYRQAAACDPDDAGDSRARTLLALGEAYHALCRYSNAEEAVKEALAIFIIIANEEGQGHASLLLARIFKSQSRHNEEKEKEALVQAEAALAQIGRDGARAATLDRVDDTHLTQNGYDEAEEYRLAQAIPSSLNDVRREATELLGVSYCRHSRHDEAKDCFAEARVAYARVVNEEGEAKALDDLVKAYALRSIFVDIFLPLCWFILVSCLMYI